MHTFQAHDSAIKALALDPCEEYFTTGSAEGNIKVSHHMRDVQACYYVYLLSIPAPLPLSPFSLPDRDRRGDSPAWSGRGSRPSRSDGTGCHDLRFLNVEL